MVYNYRAGAAGVELLPHWSFWRGVPGLISDGFRYALSGCGRCGSGPAPGGQYTPVGSKGGYGTL